MDAHLQVALYAAGVRLHARVSPARKQSLVGKLEMLKVSLLQKIVNVERIQAAVAKESMLTGENL